jgi:putative heme-binding domain-containing protein
VTPRRIPNLAKLSSSELVDALDSPNGWQRDASQRLLIERGGKTILKKLENLAKSAKSEKVRVQALWTLNGLGALTPQLLIAGLKDGDTSVREHAVRLSETQADRKELFDDLLARVSDPSARVRYQVAFTLGECDGAGVAPALFKLAREEDESIRNAAISSAPRHARALLALAENSPNDNYAAAMLPMLRKLVANPGMIISQPSVIELGKTIPPEQRAERAKVLERYVGVPQLAGDSRNGAALFKQNCAQCHRLRGEGTEVGPDLGMMSEKPVVQLVEAILDPNAAVEERYRGFSVATRDGRDLTGIIVAETPTTITLRGPNQPEQTLLRGELKELTRSGLSLMPDGLESALTPQQLADLIAFVRGR